MIGEDKQIKRIMANRKAMRQELAKLFANCLY